jgi:membrane-associated protease RseP (regulator of RpoE activity)
MKTIRSMCLTMCLAAVSGPILMAAQPNKASEQTNTSARTASHTGGYLGVTVGPMHESLIARVEELLGKGSGGVLVEQVAKDSPAQSAGLRTNAILVKYNHDKITSPKELMLLIQSGKPGQEVTLGIVRAGKHETVTAKLGELRENQRHRAAARSKEHSVRTASRVSGESMWTSFDEMTLTRLNDRSFKAQIKYEDPSGKIETRSFEGTREEIRKDIESQKGLPRQERQHLLRALDFPSDVSSVVGDF